MNGTDKNSDDAIELGHVHNVLNILSGSIDKISNKSFEWALKLASKRGYIGRVNTLLDRDFDKISNKGFGQALEFASNGGHTGIVNVLLDRALGKIPYKSLGQALECASNGGHTDIVKVLLDRAFDKIPHKNFEHALELASKKGHVLIVKLLNDITRIRNENALDPVARYGLEVPFHVNNSLDYEHKSFVSNKERLNILSRTPFTSRRESVVKKFIEEDIDEIRIYAPAAPGRGHHDSVLSVIGQIHEMDSRKKIKVIYDNDNSRHDDGDCRTKFSQLIPDFDKSKPYQKLSLYNDQIVEFIDSNYFLEEMKATNGRTILQTVTSF